MEIGFMTVICAVFFLSHWKNIVVYLFIYFYLYIDYKISISTNIEMK